MFSAEVVGQRGDDLDPVLGEELGQVLLARREQDGQVAAVDDVRAQRRAPRPTSQRKCGFSSGAPPVMSTVGIPRPGREVEAGGHRLPAHHLAAVGPGVDVAVPAGLVAELADVDLEDRDPLGPERTQPVAGQGPEERSPRPQPQGSQAGAAGPKRMTLARAGRASEACASLSS